MILVAGGTGTLGTLLVRRLTARGLRVRVLTRKSERASHLAGALVEIVLGDVRDTRSITAAMNGVDLVVSAVHGFGASDVSPASVDRDGNVNLIERAASVGAAFVLVSIIGAAPDSSIDLFRAKYDAEEHLRRSSLRWTIVRASAFIETWAGIMRPPSRGTGKTLVLGRGDNKINFVSVTDVAALLELAVVDEGLRGRVVELGGSRNLSFNELAAMLQAAGYPGPVRHIPRAVLRAMSILMRPVNPGFARHARAAVVMDTEDMSFDARATRAAFPGVPEMDLLEAVRSGLRQPTAGSRQRPPQG